MTKRSALALGLVLLGCSALLRADFLFWLEGPGDKRSNHFDPKSPWFVAPATPTPLPTPSYTLTSSTTPSHTPTISPTPTFSATLTYSNTVTSSFTISPTPTASPS